MTWDVLNVAVLLETPRAQITRETVRLEDGRVIDDYYQIHMGEAAVIAAQDEAERFLVLRLYKHGPRRTGLGFPGGGIEPGEAPLAAARRELVEETGLTAPDWRALGAYAVHSNQGCGTAHFFFAKGAVPVAAPDAAGDLERHEVLWLTRDDLAAALQAGEFVSMGHACMAGLVLSLT